MKTSKLAQKVSYSFFIPFLFSLLFLVGNTGLNFSSVALAQEEEAEEAVITEETDEEEEEEVSAPITLDHVLVNNERVEISEENTIPVSPDDAVRILGESTPESKLSVFFGEKEVKTTVLGNGTWFVLFSITGLEDGEYPVTALLEGSDEEEESVKLVTLVVGEGGRTNNPNLDPTIGFFSNLDIGAIPASVLILTSIPIAIFLGFVLGIQLERRKNKVGKKKGKK